MKRIIAITILCALATLVFGQGVGIDMTGPRADTRLDVNGAIGTTRMGRGGTYISTEVQGIWSIAPNYQISTANNDFGNQYGMTYAHTNAGVGTVKQPISGWGHQVLFTDNGNRNAAISLSSGHGYFAGNVGIGTTNPAEKLDVNGYIETSSGVKFGDGSTQTRASRDILNVYFAITPATRQTIASITPTAITGLTITLTPASVNSKFAIMAVVNGTMEYVTSTLIYRGSSPILTHTGNTNEPGAQVTTYGWSDNDRMAQNVINHIDEPNTTSAITYTVRLTSGWAGAASTSYVNDRSSNDMRTPSTLTILEFAY